MHLIALYMYVQYFTQLRMNAAFPLYESYL